MGTRRHTARVAAIAMAAVALPAAPAAAAAPWSPVSTLSTMPVTNTEEPAVVTDSVGNAVAVWIGSTGVEAASRPAGGGWSAPETLSDTAAVTGPPQVAVNDVGTVTVAWIEDNAVQVADRSNPGTWTGPEPVSGGAAPSPTGGLDLDVMGAGGRTAVVWLTPDLVVYGVVGAASAGGWETPVALSDEALFAAANPSVGFDSAGHATAVWAEGATFASNDTIESSVHPLGGEWAAAVQLNGTGVTSVTAPTLAVSASGSATVAWSAGPEGTRNKAVIQAVSRTSGGPWTAPEDLSDPLLFAETPKAAMSPDGDAVVVWNQQGDFNQHTQAVHRPSGGSWGEVANLSDQGSRSFAEAIMVADDGAATAAWEFDDSGTTIIQAARMSPSGAWSAPIDVTDASADRTDPALAIDGPGNVTAVFMARPDDFQVESASLDTTGPTVGSLGIPAGGIVGQAVSFFATASDLWSSVASYSWTFGDGASADGPAPSHAYVAPGSYPVSVTVTDSVGNTTTRSATTTVTAAGAPPLQPPTKHAPEITVFKVKDTRIQGIARAAADAPEKTKLKVRLTAAAELRLVLTSKHRHLVDGKLKYVKVTLTRRLPAGRGSVTLKGRLATIKLLPDTYRIVGTATNTIGGSNARKARLVVVATSDHSFQTNGGPR